MNNANLKINVIIAKIVTYLIKILETLVVSANQDGMLKMLVQQQSDVQRHRDSISVNRQSA